MNRNFIIRMAGVAILMMCGSALAMPASATFLSQSVLSVGARVTKLASSGPEVMPPALRPVFYQSLTKHAGTAYNLNAKGCATLPQRKLTACFNSGGAHFSGAGSLALRLVGYGRGQALSPLKPVQPEMNGNRVSYEHGNLSAWWRVLPVGFEQGFTITKRPTGMGELTLAIATNARAARQSGAFGWGKLRYGRLVVTDANGKVVPANLKSEGDRVLITVNDAHAVYPLVVDPLVWLEQEVTASDGETNDSFGYRVALDGATALIASPFANSDQGKVYVFTESNGVWSQAQELTASDGAPGDNFGNGVALYGTTALISANTATVDGNIGEGKAYFFTEANGTWTQTQEITPSDGAAYGTFGQGAALSDETAFISAGGGEVNGNPISDSVYVFTESGGTWTQTQKILSPNPAGDEFGFQGSMAISGATAVVGAFAATVKGNPAQGNAVVYTESGGTWTRAQVLVASDGGAVNFFGDSAAIQGNIILIGAEAEANNSKGAAYVFTESDGTWNQAQELTASDGQTMDSFGSFVALNDPIALIGAIGANSDAGKAYVFTDSNGTWTQTQELFPSDQQALGFFGFAGAISGSTGLIDAQGLTVNGNNDQGAAYFFGQSDLGLALSAPQTVGQGQQYTSQTIATNSSSTPSPAVSATISVPTAASFVSATSSQGSCSQASGVVTCDFGPIAGNAGMATASVTLKVTGSAGTTIENTASVALATPALTASAPTGITSPAACPAGYTEFSGHLDAGESFTSEPITVSEAGQKYVDLTSPASFGFFTITTTSYGMHTYVYPHAKQGHRWGAAGSYRVGVQAGPSAGGDYTLCVNLNPAQ